MHIVDSDPEARQWLRIQVLGPFPDIVIQAYVSGLVQPSFLGLANVDGLQRLDVVLGEKELFPGSFPKYSIIKVSASWKTSLCRILKL